MPHENGKRKLNRDARKTTRQRLSGSAQMKAKNKETQSEEQRKMLEIEEKELLAIQSKRKKLVYARLVPKNKIDNDSEFNTSYNDELLQHFNHFSNEKEAPKVHRSRGRPRKVILQCMEEFEMNTDNQAFSQDVMPSDSNNVSDTPEGTTAVHSSDATYCMDSMKSMYHMQQKGLYCDFSITVMPSAYNGLENPVTYAVHRLVFATKSPRIEQLQRDRLKIGGKLMCGGVMRVIEYVYTGTVTGVDRLPLKDVTEINSAALALDVQICDYLKKERQDFVEDSTCKIFLSEEPCSNESFGLTVVKEETSNDFDITLEQVTADQTILDNDEFENRVIRRVPEVKLEPLNSYAGIIDDCHVDCRNVLRTVDEILNFSSEVCKPQSLNLKADTFSTHSSMQFDLVPMESLNSVKCIKIEPVDYWILQDALHGSTSLNGNNRVLNNQT